MRTAGTACRTAARRVAGVAVVLGAAAVPEQPALAQSARLAGGPVLPTGTRVSVRLLDAVIGTPAARGAPVRALVIAPVRLGARVTLAAGDTVVGVVRDAGTEGAGGRRHTITLAFDRLAGPGRPSIPLVPAARVVAVPNARETVDAAGRIVGPERPGFRRSPEAWAAVLLGTADPLAGAVFLAAFDAEAVERHRRIAFGPGVEMTLALGGALALPAWPPVPSVPPAPPAAVDALAGAPLRVVTAKGGLPADVLNLALVGTWAEVAAAFRAAGWTEPDRSSVRADLETLAAAARARGFDAQPVSTLVLDGRAPGFVFEKVVDSMAKRHHLRVWSWGGAVDGRPLWLVAATRDDGILFSRARRTFGHRVDPDVDAERQKVVDDLLAAGVVAAESWRPRTPPAERVLVNDGATPIATDWRLAVLVLAPSTRPAPP